MSWSRWLRSQAKVTRSLPHSKSRRPRRTTLFLESLELRVVPTIKALSTTDPGLLSDTAAGNVYGPASVSQDGRYVVYTDTAANITPGQVMDPHTSYDVFLYDRGTGTT